MRTIARWSLRSRLLVPRLSCAAAQSTLIDGQITKVDPSAGKITIKHGPIKKLGMDMGMTMVFKARTRHAHRRQGRRQGEVRCRSGERPICRDKDPKGEMTPRARITARFARPRFSL